MPDETVMDGEVVALDESWGPSFNALQNYGPSAGTLGYYLFDVMIIGGRDVMGLPLHERCQIVQDRVLCQRADPIRESPVFRRQPSGPDPVSRGPGVEGVVAKRRDSGYEASQRSGTWQKMRVTRGQEFVIGGYTLGETNFDALMFGYSKGDRLIYAARTRGEHTRGAPPAVCVCFSAIRGIGTTSTSPLSSPSRAMSASEKEQGVFVRRAK